LKISRFNITEKLEDYFGNLRTKMPVKMISDVPTTFFRY
jgi:hypothetical protein